MVCQFAKTWYTIYFFNNIPLETQLNSTTQPKAIITKQKRKPKTNFPTNIFRKNFHILNFFVYLQTDG